MSILGDPARTPLAWYWATSTLVPMPKGPSRLCVPAAVRDINNWIRAGAKP